MLVILPINLRCQIIHNSRMEDVLDTNVCRIVGSSLSFVLFVVHVLFFFRMNVYQLICNTISISDDVRTVPRQVPLIEQELHTIS